MQSLGVPLNSVSSMSYHLNINHCLSLLPITRLAKASSISTNHHQQYGVALRRSQSTVGILKCGATVRTFANTSSTGRIAVVPFFGTAPSELTARSARGTSSIEHLKGPTDWPREHRWRIASDTRSRLSTADLQFSPTHLPCRSGDSHVEWERTDAHARLHVLSKGSNVEVASKDLSGQGLGSGVASHLSHQRCKVTHVQLTW